MSIVRNPGATSRFTVMPKSVTDDSRLSWEARGLLQYILAKPDDWTVRTTDLINQTRESMRPTGRDGVQGLIDELEYHGYLSRSARREDAGKFAGVDYVAYDQALPEEMLAEVRKRFAEKQARKDRKAQAQREKRAGKKPNANKALRPQPAVPAPAEADGSPQPCVPATGVPEPVEPSLNKYQEAISTEKALNTESSAGVAGASQAAREVEGELLEAEASDLPAGFKTVNVNGHALVVPKNYPVDERNKGYRAWYNYAVAYHARYGMHPIYNAKVAKNIADVVERVGADVAPKVAAWYVKLVNDALVVNRCHPVDLLLKGCEGYAIQYQTGRNVTMQEARNLERTAANLNTLHQLNGTAPVPPSDEYSRTLAELNGGA